MQPLLYLTTRILLSYLQALLREERIFLQAATSTLATGGGHCWALVYGLMIAVLMQSVRMQGTPDTSALPWWMNFAERLASTTMLLWTLAGTAAAYIRTSSCKAYRFTALRTAAPAPPFSPSSNRRSFDSA